MKRQHEIEDDIAGIRAWEDTIVRILTDGHAKRVELEKELKELKMAADDKNKYGIQVGGCALIKDGRHAGSFGAACEYADMSYKHVQGFWHALTTDPEAMAAIAECNLKLTSILVALGDKYGLQQGRLTEADVEEVKKFKNK